MTEAREQVTLLSQAAPAGLPSFSSFAWTAGVTDQQRQQMIAEAQEALHEGTAHGDRSLVEALVADWAVAQKLLALPPNWRVSDAWFWMPQWQAGEREVDAELAAGHRGQIYESDEAFLSALDAHAERHAHVSTTPP